MRLRIVFSVVLKRLVNTRVSEPVSNYVCQKRREKLVLRVFPERRQEAVAQLMS